MSEPREADVRRAWNRLVDLASVADELCKRAAKATTPAEIAAMRDKFMGISCEVTAALAALDPEHEGWGPDEYRDRVRAHYLGEVEP